MEEEDPICMRCGLAQLAIDPHAGWRRDLTPRAQYDLCDRCAREVLNGRIYLGPIKLLRINEKVQ